MSGICRRIACGLVLLFALVAMLVPLTALALGASGAWNWSSYLPSRVNGVAYSPAFGSDRTAFAATSGGLYYSTDGAVTWNRSTSPVDPATIIYGVAVSPDFAADKTVFSAAFGPGVLISRDGGKTSYVATGSAGAARCVAVSPDYADDGTVIVGTMRGLKRSTDRGVTWTSLKFPDIALEDIADVFSVAFSPEYAFDRTLLCAVNNVGLFRSTDGGDTWEPVGASVSPPRIWRFVFSPDFATDHTVYAASEYWCRVYRSTDGGSSWSESNLVAAQPSKTARVTGLALSPGYQVDHTVYAAAETKLYKSTDYGSSWSATDIGTSAGSSNIFDLALSPQFTGDGEMLLAREYHGVSRTTDRGLTFKPMTVGLADQSPYAIGFSPAFASDRTVFTATERGVFRSKDGGTTWTSFAEKTGMLDAPALAVSPAYPRDRTVLAGGGGTWRTTDGGDTWTQNTTIWGVRALAMSPAFESDHIAFAGAVDNTGSGAKGVFRSVNGGQSWTISTGIPTDRTVTAIAASPTFATDHTVFAATSIQVYRSTDGGASFSIVPVSGAWDFQSIAISPDFARDRTVFVGSSPQSNGGVFRSTDAGDTWSQFNGGGLTSTASVLGLAVSPGYAGDGLVYAATGAGLLARAKGTTWVDVPVVNRASAFYSIALSPAFQTDGIALAGTDGSGVTEPGDPPTPVIRPGAPSWIAPATDGQEGLSATPALQWSSVVASPAVDAYEVGVYDGRGVLLASNTSTATTFTVPGSLLVEHRAYYGKVRSHSKNGWSDPAVRTFYVGTAPPAASAPALVAPVNDATGLSTTPLLDWSDLDAAYGADWYRVSVRDGSGREVAFADSAASQWTPAAGALQSGRRYYWDVSAHNARGYSDPSETRAFLAGAAPATVPVAPQPLYPAPSATWVAARPFLGWRANASSDVVDYYWAEVWDGDGNLVASGLSTDLGWQVPVEDTLTTGAYVWRVFAHNYTGWGPPSAETWFWVGKPPLPLPDAPDALTPDTGSVGLEPNWVTLQWSSIAATQEPDSYYCAVYDEDGGLVADKLVSASTYQWKVPDGVLDVSRAYSWAVWAHNDTGWSEPSEFQWFATVDVPGPPLIPLDLSPDDWQIIDDPTPTLYWNDYNGVGAVQYLIDGAWIEIYEESGRRVYSGASARNSFTVPPGVLEYGTWYLWSVCSHNVCGWGDWSYWGSFGLAPPYPPSTPYLLSPADEAMGLSASSVTLQCAPAVGATAYDFVLTDAYGNTIWEKVTTATSVTVPSWLLQNGRWYGWGVWAMNDGGETPSSLRFFMVGSPPTPPAAPVLYTPENKAEWVDQGAFLNWSDSAGATYYRVSVFDKDGVAAEADVTKSEWWVPLGKLKPNTRYWWMVWAANGGGASPDGEMRTFVCWGPKTVKSLAPGGSRSLSALGAEDAEPPGVTLVPGQAAVDVVAGANATFGVKVRGAGGYGGTARMSVRGLPAGANASWSTTTTSVGATTTLTVRTTGVAEGVYPLAITATGGTGVARADVALRVFRSTSGSFAVGLVQPVRAATAGGAPVTFNVTISAQSGFTGPVDLSVSGLPAGARASFLPPRVTTSGSSVLTIETSAGVEPDAYALRVAATSAGRSSSALGRIDIYPPGRSGFTLACEDATQAVGAGGEARWRFSALPTGSMRMPVEVSVAGALPAGTVPEWRVTPADGEPVVSAGDSAVVPMGGSAELRLSLPRSLEATDMIMLVSGSTISTRTTLPIALRIEESRVESATMTVSSSPKSSVTYGKTAVFSAMLKIDGVLVPDANVSLWRSTDGGETWSRDGAAVWSASSGTYRATSQPLTANTQFMMRSAGTSRTASVGSKPAVLTAKAYLGTPSTASTVRRSKSFTVSGSLKPYHGGSTKLYFYRKSGGKWRYAKSVSAKNSAYKSYTKYSVKTKLKSTGSWYVIAKHSDSSHAATTSPRRYFKVR